MKNVLILIGSMLFIFTYSQPEIRIPHIDTVIPKCDAQGKCPTIKGVKLTCCGTVCCSVCGRGDYCF